MRRSPPKSSPRRGAAKIRLAARSDLPALLRIYNHSVETSHATFDLVPQTMSQREKWFSEHRGTHPLVVAEVKGEVAGYASISTYRKKPAYSRTVESSVYVGEGFQRSGVGALLMGDILARAKKLGYHAVVAGIALPNEASVRLHEKMGFEFAGSLREAGQKFGRWWDVALYQLLLDRT